MWSLYSNEKYLKPLVFSNGKTQETIVSEILGEVKKGTKVIFIRGACGTGKSAIALNLAKELGKTSIVVPGKNLQRQYKRDYEKEKYVLKKNKEKLKISVITGRNNHKCKFLEDNETTIPKIKKEVNSKLYDIFAGKRKMAEEEIKEDASAENKNLPCKIEIREKNWDKLKKYISQNKFIDGSKISELNDVKRIAVGSVCPYWSPVLKSKYEINGPIFKSAKKKKYVGLEGIEFTFYERKKGCPFYEQFNSFIEADVIVFNSMKYKLESAMNRKPQTEIEVIDECDDFLDSFANQKSINLDRFQNALIHEAVHKEKEINSISEILSIINHIKSNKKYQEIINENEIIPLKRTGIYDLLNLINKDSEIFEGVDDESYLFHVGEVAKNFSELIGETYVTVTKKDKGLIFNLVATNLAKKFNELVNKNKFLILMSGTIHSPEVLKNIFDLKDFIIIDAEPKAQGEITVKRIGREIDCKYSNFQSDRFTRKEYLQILDECIIKAPRPTVVHINAFNDLPTTEEVIRYSLKSIKSREEIRENQNMGEGKDVNDFKKGFVDILFSTRVSRGIDFPGDQCKSIIFTKYPNPNVKDPFWKILYKTKPNEYWQFYKDKAVRELLQKLYRGLRFKEDHVYVLSPDTRVLDFFEKEYKSF